jgi:hypothetical protein
MATKPIPTTSTAVLHHGHQQVATSLFAATRALRGDSFAVSVLGAHPFGPHCHLHRPHNPLPPLLPRPPAHLYDVLPLTKDGSS